MVESRIIQYEVAAGGNRLDRDIADRVGDLSRSAVQRLNDEGHIAVNGESRRSSHILQVGDVVRITIPPPHPVDIVPEEIPLDILYEDEAILVINKAAGMVVHPGAGHRTGTMVNAILAHCPDLKGVGGELRPGIVHRLDKDTSGVIIVAKDDVSIHQLQRQFKKRTTEKTYIALVTGRLPQSQGLIEAPIGRHRVHRQRMAVQSQGKHALTRWEVDKHYRDAAGSPYTLVTVDLLTGRTHQIRVHFAWMGYPLAGDRVYGPAKTRLNCPRQFLHAARLAITHPTTREPMVFSAPLPEDLRRVLAELHTVDND